MNILKNIYQRTGQFLFYLIGLILSMILLVGLGTGNSHTPPPAFIFSTLIILIGLIIMAIEALVKRFKNLDTSGWEWHLVGIGMHILFVVFLVTSF